MLKVENVTKYYDNFRAVHDLSFEIEEGEIFGLLGVNGAGKTTTLRIMSTLIKADSGNVIINNLDVNKNQFEIRKNIAFLTSELKLEEFFTVDYMYDFYSSLHDVDIETRERSKVPDGIAHFLEHKMFEQENGTNSLDTLTALGRSL